MRHSLLCILGPNNHSKDQREIESGRTQENNFLDVIFLHTLLHENRQTLLMKHLIYKTKKSHLRNEKHHLVLQISNH